MTCKKQNISLALLMCLFLLSLWPFYIRVADCFLHPEQQNTTDMDIFAGAAKNYLRTGELYQRSDNYQKTYAPGEGVYKFPPAYQLTILPLLKYYPDNFNFLFAQRIIHLSLYLCAALLLIATIGKQFIWADATIMHKKHRYRSIQFILTSLIFITWSMGFFESFSGIEPEILVFFLLALAFYFSIRNAFASGALIGIAAAIKIYPIFILLYFILKPNTKAISGFLTGLLLITLLSVCYIGISEHIFYLKNILPVLLQEKPIYHIQNTTVEALFHARNLIPVMSGLITSMTKLFTIITVILVGAMTDRKTKAESLLFYSMLISGILLWLSNYWPQYQVILIIPMLCLLAYAIMSKSNTLYFVMIILGIAMSAEEMWFGELIHMTAAYEAPQNIEPITRFIKQHPSSDPIFYFSPLLWILKRIKDLVFLLPVIFFLMSAWILVSSRSNKGIRIFFNHQV